MKNEYDHKKIENKWQKEWDKKKIYEVKNTAKRKKFYGLIEFPYPSGAGLHVGHIRSNTAMDIISRKRRMEGYNVLYPIGWDAFGLPTENFAIKTGMQPEKVTKQNTDTFRRQLKSLGFSFDWSREVNTTDPAYYKWTQWIFLQMYKKGLAYKAKTEINWCPKDKIGLANEEAAGGVCDRCGGPVEKRLKEQWMLAITKYADRLDKDLDDVDFLPQIKTQQRNWIGKSEGSIIKFDDIEVFTTRADTLFGATYVAISGSSDRFTGRFVTNPATKEKIPVWEAEYVMNDYGTGAVMGVPAHDERDFEFAKKHDLPIKRVLEPKFYSETSPIKEGLPIIKRNAMCAIIRNPKDGRYLCSVWKKVHMQGLITGGIEEGEDIEKAALREIYEETGYKNLKLIHNPEIVTNNLFYHRVKNENRWACFNYLFFDLVNEEQDPINEEELAIHDIVWKSRKELENFFSVNEGKFGLKLIDDANYIHTGEGLLTNSGKFDGMDSADAMKEITKEVGGKIVTKYKLRDWVFSRQRYWGEPIPLINCGKCGYVPVADKDLPVTLPKVKSYQPTDNGESPLANIKSWVNVKCPKCKGNAVRETDTMPNWAGSSWYFLRYTDPKNKKEFASKSALKYWMKNGVDWYNGGMEHTTLHLLYSRFWHKFLYDIKVVPTKEPYMKRTSHGMILADGGEKMSKSKGNVVNPDDLVKVYGADTIRMYEMFMGPFDQAVSWSTDSMVGPRRFLERVWRLSKKIASQNMNSKGPRISSSSAGARRGQTILPSYSATLHKTIKKVGENIEGMNFNTAISSMMICLNEMEKSESIPLQDFKMFLQILAPFVPHITEELWQNLGEKKSIHKSPWPKYDKRKLVSDSVKIAIQVNGKVRGEIIIGVDDSEDAIKEKAKNDASVKTWIEGKEVKKIIYVKGRLINIVV